MNINILERLILLFFLGGGYSCSLNLIIVVSRHLSNTQICSVYSHVEYIANNSIYMALKEFHDMIQCSRCL